MEKSGIYFKIDWYSAVFNACSINDILAFLHLEHEHDDFFERCFSRALGYDTQVTYAFDGVSIAVSYSLVNHLAANTEDESVFDFVFDRLRLDISGSGLDAMRKKWEELGAEPGTFDEYLRTEPVLPRGDMHITRCDFAFDLIDYKPEFLDTIIEHLSKCEYKRVPIMHTCGGLNYSVRTGDQKTVYLGSSRSDKMLRIYDKKMQLTDDDGVWLKAVDHADCSSWIRIELQTRNKIAHGLCLGEGDSNSIFRFIYDTYCFRDTNYHVNTPKPVKFWDDLFDWANAPRIIQNLHVGIVESITDKAERFLVNTAFSSFMVHAAVNGIWGIIHRYVAMLHDIQGTENRSFSQERKLRSLLIKLKMASKDGTLSSLPGIKIIDGEIYLKF